MDQPSLQQLTDAVGAVQQREVAPVEIARRLVAQEIGEQPVRFLSVVVEGVRPDAVLRLAIGLELLLEQRGVLRDEPACHLEDLPRAAAVPVEHDRFGDVEVGAEAVEDGGVGAGPGEDGLLVVADREAVAVLGGQAGHDLVLGQAQVLEFVHQDAVPAGPELRARLRIAADQLAGEPDEVVVVHQVAGAERLAIGAEQLEVARRERDVLQPVAAEQGEQLTDPLAPHPEPAEEAGLVVLVRDAEPTAEPGRCRILAQDRETERVERAAGDLLGGGAELRRGAVRRSRRRPWW